MHSLLRRQLKKCCGQVDLRAAGLEAFVEGVNQAYEQFDDDRRMLERSLELSSAELLDANAQMQAIYDTAPVCILQEDWREVIQAIEQLQGAGVSDFEGYFRTHPEFVRRAAEAVKICDVNQWTLETFAGNKVQMLGAFARVFAAPEAMPGLIGELTALAQGQAVYRSEMGLQTLKGTKIHGLVAMSLPAADAGTGKVLVSVVDLTERKRAEEALRRSEEHYRLLFDTILQGVVYQDHEGRIISMNPAATRILGRSSEELLGRDSFPPEREAVREDGSTIPRMEYPSIVAFRSGREVRDVVMGVHNPRENACRWINIRAVPLFRPGEALPYQVYTIFDDITERWRNEREIRRQTQILLGMNRVFHETLACETDAEVAAVFVDVCRGLTGSALGFVEEVDGEGHWEPMMGSPPGAEAAMQLSDAVDPWPRLHSRLREMVLSLRSSQIVNAAEVNLDSTAPPGARIPIRRCLLVPLSESGRTFGLVGLANKDCDYTEEDRRSVEAVAPAFVEALNRKRAQRAVEALNEQLAVRATALERANHELESFSYSVSHDLRAPLRIIDGFSRIVLEDYSDKLDAEGQERLRTVRMASQRMGQLIDDLLQLSRISRSGMQTTLVNLSALVRDVLAELQACDPQRRVELQIEGDLTACADPRLIRIALENLLGNAWKFTGHEALARIEFGRTTHDGMPVFFVRDNGVGFDMAYSHDLFGAFQRLHTTAEFPGTGIGLATVERIIHRHGGLIWGEGEPGRGATFYFHLPNELKVE